ncbi:hypothetical protein PV773_08235 [Mesorhizobium sp. CC13]|uniref:hypothetical protein n=1 Tax=Mesorhizobium sp. CC13 TaxID=3029194 RepID=UPI003263AD45
MAEILQFGGNHVFVKRAEDVWIVRVLEDGDQTDYTFDHCKWAEKFARDQRIRIAGRNG